MKKLSMILSSVFALVCMVLVSALAFYAYNGHLKIMDTSRTIEEISGEAADAHTTLDTADASLSTSISEKETAIAEKKEEIEAQEEAEAAAPASNGYIVAIDPGHQSWNIDMSALEPMGPGSSDMKAKATSGTSGTYSGLAEYELNMDVSLKLRDILEERGYTVVLTRENNDTAISNAERAQLATDAGANIYVRIHANGDDSHTASGALTMVPSTSNPYVGSLSEESQRLGQCILDSYCEATGFSSLGVQYYDNMTGINWSTVPVTIIEMGFMTYESDDLQMADPDFQEVMAGGIADGIDAYFGL
jgi:N-acetylmuramoyl-L-alanine amidase